MANQKTDPSTNCGTYYGGNKACGEITNAQSKDHKKYNEYPRTTFAFDFRRSRRLAILRMVMFFMAMVTTGHILF
jgi:hypothetical protein